MGLEINIRAVINLALPLVCSCPQGQRSIRVESECCLDRNKDRRGFLYGCVSESTKNSKGPENGGFAKRFIRCLSVFGNCRKDCYCGLTQDELKTDVYFAERSRQTSSVIKETNDVFLCANKYG